MKFWIFFNPGLQLIDTWSTIKNWVIYLLSKLRGFKFVTTLVLEFKKIESDDERNCNTFYSISKAETIINRSDIDDVIESIYITIIWNMQKSMRKGFGWVIDSVKDSVINISKHKPLAGSRYIKLPKEFDHPKKACWILKILI